MKRSTSKACRGSGSWGPPQARERPLAQLHAFRWAGRGVYICEQSCWYGAEESIYLLKPELQPGSASASALREHGMPGKRQLGSASGSASGSGAASGSASRLPMGWPGSLHLLAILLIYRTRPYVPLEPRAPAGVGLSIARAWHARETAVRVGKGCTIDSSAKDGGNDGGGELHSGECAPNGQLSCRYVDLRRIEIDVDAGYEVLGVKGYLCSREERTHGGNLIVICHST